MKKIGSRPLLSLGPAIFAFLLFTSLVRAQTLDGSWISEGYGLLIDIHGSRMTGFETTSLSCLPSWKMVRQAGQTTGSEVVFAGEPGTLRVLPGPSDDTKLLDVDGAVSSIVLRRVRESPAICREPKVNSPLANYDIFWKTFAEHYPFFELHKIDWLAVDGTFRPQVKPTTTPQELSRIFRAMIEPLDDAHTSFSAPAIKDGYEGGKPDSLHFSELDSRRASRIIATKYIRGGVRSFCNGSIEYGLLSHSVGYLRIKSFYGYTKDDDYWKGFRRLNSALDQIFASSGNLKGLVIDVRNNPGGADPYGIAIAARLTGQRYLAYSKIARNDPHNSKSFTAPQAIFVIPETKRAHFLGAVVLLIGRDSVSAAETFAMALLGRTPKVVRVGENTQGVFSDVLERTLPNGWSFGLPNEIYLTSDGRAFDVLGVPPDVAVPIFPRQDLLQGRDSALDKALEILTVTRAFNQRPVAPATARR